MTENELFRIKGEKKGVALLEYYRIIVTDQRIIVARTNRGRTYFTALAPKTKKFDKMTPEEVLCADKNNFALSYNDIMHKGKLIGGAIIVPDKNGKMLKIRILPGDFKKLKQALTQGAKV